MEVEVHVRTLMDFFYIHVQLKKYLKLVETQSRTNTMCKPTHHLISCDELYIPEDALIQNIPRERGEDESDEKRDDGCLETSKSIGKFCFLMLIIILIVMLIYLPWFYFELRDQRVQINELHQQIKGNLGQRGGTPRDLNSYVER